MIAYWPTGWARDLDVNGDIDSFFETDRDETLLLSRADDDRDGALDLILRFGP